MLGVGVADRALADPPSLSMRDDAVPRVAQAAADVSGLARMCGWRNARRDPLAPDRDGDTAIHVAATMRNAACLERLLVRGLSPDAHNHINGRIPIMSAMLAERDRQFAILLAAGANLALADRTGNTPLHVAAQINAPGHVLALLKAGAPADARNAQGQSFQRYLFMTPDHLLNEETRRSRRAVAVWLQQNGIALETDTP